MNQGVFRHKRRVKMKMDELERRMRERRAHEEKTYSALWRTVPNPRGRAAPSMTQQGGRAQAQAQSAGREHPLSHREEQPDPA